MPNYIDLKPLIYTIEEITEIIEKDDNYHFDRVDNIVLQFGTRFVHLGRICYKVFKVKSKDNRELKVNPNSLNLNAVEFAQKLLPYLAESMMDGKRVYTLYGVAVYFISLFNFIRTENLNVACNKASIKAFINNYTNDLLHQIKIYDRTLKLGLSTKMAQASQSRVISFFAYSLDLEPAELTSGLVLIQRNDSQIQSALALEKEDFAKQFNLYTQVFRQFTSIILDDKEIPTPVYVNGDKLWVAPSNTQWLKPKHKQSIGLRGFNYSNGHFYTVEELERLDHCKGKKRYQLSQHVAQAYNAKVRANKAYSSLRLLLAGWACHAYFMHFLIVTGENDSTAASLSFENEFFTDKSEQNFKSIKWRANGVTVKYSIQNEFIGDFKRYIQLRRYLIEYYQQEYTALFIGSTNRCLTPLNTTGNVSSSFRKLFSSMFFGEPLTGASKSFRVSKSLWIRNNHGAGISSYIMQHDANVADSHYTGMDDLQSTEQLSGFFEEINNHLLIESHSDETITSGHCKEYLSPKPLSTISSNDDIKVNCENSEGCLFCSKFRVHADDADIRKLFSMKYLILQSQDLAFSQSHFDKIYKPVLTRIDNIIDLISIEKPSCLALIESVRKEVFEQELLSEYWYRKLELLNDLGLI